MNRYETTLTLTVSIKAVDENDARRQLRGVENALLTRNFGQPLLTEVTYVQGGEEFDCMESGV